MPCIRGMRITVFDVFSYLASGMSEDEVRTDFPELTHEDFLACYAYAADPGRVAVGVTCSSSSSTRIFRGDCRDTSPTCSRMRPTSRNSTLRLRATMRSGTSRTATASPSYRVVQ